MFHIIQQYKSNDAQVMLDVLIENETIWLTQSQIGVLFGVQKAAISKHLKNIFESGELNQDSVVSILETTARDGKNYSTHCLSPRCLSQRPGKETLCLQSDGSKGKGDCLNTLRFNHIGIQYHLLTAICAIGVNLTV